MAAANGHVKSRNHYILGKRPFHKMWGCKDGSKCRGAPPSVGGATHTFSEGLRRRPTHLGVGLTHLGGGEPMQEPCQHFCERRVQEPCQGCRCKNRANAAVQEPCQPFSARTVPVRYNLPSPAERGSSICRLCPWETEPRKPVRRGVDASPCKFRVSVASPIFSRFFIYWGY